MAPPGKKMLSHLNLDSGQRGNFMGNKDGQRDQQLNITDVLHITFQEAT